MVQKVGHEWCRTALKHNAGLPASQVLFLMHACSALMLLLFLLLLLLLLLLCVCVFAMARACVSAYCACMFEFVCV